MNFSMQSLFIINLMLEICIMIYYKLNQCIIINKIFLQDRILMNLP